MVQKRIVLSVLLLAVVLGGGAIYAQDGDSTDWLTIYSNGEFWFANETRVDDPATWEACGKAANGEEPISRLIMSPNGDHLAYLNFVAGFDFLTFGIAAPPPNVIRICNGIDLVEILATAQPEDVAFDLEAGFNYISHSQPAWSPDSRQLAWTQIRIGDETEALELVVYDLASGTSQVISSDFPPQFGMPIALPVKWGEMGIAVISETFDESEQLPRTEILLFAPDGSHVEILAVPFSNDSAYLYDVVFATYQEQEREILVALHNDGSKSYYDPLIGGWVGVEGVLQVYAPEAPAESLSINFAYGSDNTQTMTQPLWELNLLDGNKILMDYYDLPSMRTIAIAPNGQSVAFVTDRVYLWQDGAVQAVALPNEGELTGATSIVWSPLAWRVVPGGYGG